MNPTREAATEAAKVLDTLAAVSVELSCHCDVPPHTLVLSASKLQETCARIDDAVAALKNILMIAVSSGQGPVSNLGTSSAHDNVNDPDESASE